MKKKLIIALLIILFVVIGIWGKNIDFSVMESPNGDYQIVSWLIDKGGFGYSGAYYIKEKGLFSPWYKLGTGPSSCKWISERVFSVYHANPTDGDIHNYSDDIYYKEFSVDDFFPE